MVIIGVSASTVTLIDNFNLTEECALADRCCRPGRWEFLSIELYVSLYAVWTDFPTEFFPTFAFILSLFFCESLPYNYRQIPH